MSASSTNRQFYHSYEEANLDLDKDIHVHFASVM